MFTASPACTSFARFTPSPFTSTLPPSIASTASDRVLKKRAAQSHLSSRVRVVGQESGTGDSLLLNLYPLAAQIPESPHEGPVDPVLQLHCPSPRECEPPIGADGAAVTGVEKGQEFR